MNKKILYFVFVMFILIELGEFSSALGITPGASGADYVAGGKESFTFTIINSEKTAQEVEIDLQGELASNMAVDKDIIEFAANEEEKKVTVTLIMPPSMPPGLHKGQLVATQKKSVKSSGQATIGAAVAVAADISFFVPYPGKYVEGKLEVSGNEERKQFRIPIINRGKETINKVSALIVVYDKNQNEIVRLNTNEISMNPGDLREISALWNVNVSKGKYLAKAVLNYDGEEVLLEKEFEVGELELELLDLFVKDFTLGGVAKFNLLVQNKWSEPILDTYAQMKVFDVAFNELADVKSALYNIPAGEKTTMVYYWDTKDMKEGTYEANVLLHYAGKKTQQDVKLQIGKDSIEVIGLGRVIGSEGKGLGSTTTILVIIIVFLVLLNVVWFLILRKRK